MPHRLGNAQVWLCSGVHVHKLPIWVILPIQDPRSARGASPSLLTRRSHHFIATTDGSLTYFSSDWPRRAPSPAKGHKLINIFPRSRFTTVFHKSKALLKHLFTLLPCNSLKAPFGDTHILDSSRNNILSPRARYGGRRFLCSAPFAFDPITRAVLHFAGVIRPLGNLVIKYPGGENMTYICLRTPTIADYCHASPCLVLHTCPSCGRNIRHCRQMLGKQMVQS